MSGRPDRLSRWHALSGIALSLFAGLHLMNHAAAFGGPIAFGAFKAFLRHFYQFPPYEIGGLLAPLLFNLVSGVWMAARRAPDRGAPARRPGWRRRLHRWSGLGLALLLLPHALSTRGAALLFHIEPDFSFVARTLEGPRGSAFWLIYGALVLAASYHLSNGIFTFFDESGLFAGRAARRAAAAAMIFVGMTLAASGMLGLLSYGGVLYPPPTVEPLPGD